MGVVCPNLDGSRARRQFSDEDAIVRADAACPIHEVADAAANPGTAR